MPATDILYVLGLVGVAVFAISGALASGERRFDLMGVICIALVTALGGGTLRDLLLDIPVFWIADPIYVGVTLVSALVTTVYTKFLKAPLKALLIADALGLALFSIGGAQLAEAQAVSPLIIILMGLFTGVVGGVLRDVLCREIPLLFQADQTLYGTAAILGVLTYLSLQQFAIEQMYCAVIGMIVVAVLRLAAIFWNLTLPIFEWSKD